MKKPAETFYFLKYDEKLDFFICIRAVRHIYGLTVAEAKQAAVEAANHARTIGLEEYIEG